MVTPAGWHAPTATAHGCVLPFLQTARLLPRPGAAPMHYSSHVVRFRRPALIEMIGLTGQLLQDHRRLTLLKREASGAFKKVEAEWRPGIGLLTEAGDVVDYAYSVEPSPLPEGWYGVRAGTPVPVYDPVPDGDSTVLELWSDSWCRVRTADIEVEGRASVRTHPEEVAAALVRLDNAPLTADLLDPVRYFFRHPDEAGFWETITSDPSDATARLIYADWLDEHGDPHAWVFREPMPFAHGYLRLEWTGAAVRVAEPLADRPWAVWEFASPTGPERGVWFPLSDGTPVPPFVAYLLGVTLLRAERPLPAADRNRLAELARAAQLRLRGDRLFGFFLYPICRITDPAKTADLLADLVQTRVMSNAVVSRFRAANGGGIGPPARAEFPPWPGVPDLRPTEADLDLLTGVCDRQMLDVVLGGAVQRAAGAKTPFSFLSVSLDHFGIVKRQLGRRVGDRVLSDVVGVLRAALPAPALLARTCEAEFGVLLPDADRDRALEVAERLRRAVAEWPGADAPATVSVGMATLGPDTPDGAAMLRDADERLHEAKQTGPNRVCG